MLKTEAERKTTLLSLPNELFLEVAEHLEPDERYGLVLTNRRLNGLLQAGMYRNPPRHTVCKIIREENLAVLKRFIENGLDIHEPLYVAKYGRERTAFSEVVDVEERRGYPMLKFLFSSGWIKPSEWTLWVTENDKTPREVRKMLAMWRGLGVRVADEAIMWANRKRMNELPWKNPDVVFPWWRQTMVTWWMGGLERHAPVWT
jgi:hypothetical protein